MYAGIRQMQRYENIFFPDSLIEELQLLLKIETMQIGENASLPEDYLADEGGAETGVDVGPDTVNAKIQLIADDGRGDGAIEHALFEVGVGSCGGGTLTDCGTPCLADVQ